MNKGVLLISTLLLVSASLCAQNVKRINEIKRNDAYLYTEVTMQTTEEAYDAACQIMLAHVKEFAKETKDVANIYFTTDILSQKCDTIQVQRGQMYKVFMYVNKELLKETPKANNTNTPSQEQAETQPEPFVETSPATPELEVEPQPAPAQTKVTVLPPDNSASKDESLRLTPAWKQNAIEELMNATSFTKARELLARMKQEYKIKKYGRPAECTDSANAFWLISSPDGSVLTVVGPDNGGRTDFSTLTKTSLDSYRGAEAIWFILSK